MDEHKEIRRMLRKMRRKMGKIDTSISITDLDSLLGLEINNRSNGKGRKIAHGRNDRYIQKLAKELSELIDVILHNRTREWQE